MDDIKYKAKKAALMKMKKMMGKADFPEGGIAAKVIAKDPKSLKKGLEKAEEFVEKMESQEECGECEKAPCECDDHEEHDFDSMSKEDLIKLLKNK